MPSSISVALQKHLGRDKKRTQSGGQLPIVSGRQHPPPILSDHAEEDPCILDDNGLADLWDEALYHYAQTTGVDLTDENTDLSQQLKNCAGYRDVVIALDRVAQAFEVYRNPHNGIGTRIRKALRPVVRAVISSGVLEASGETAASKAVPGGKALFVAVGLLLKATEGVSARFDALTKLLEKFHFFVTRLDVRTKSADLRTASRTLATRIFCNMLRTLAIAHKMMQRNRLEHFIVVLIGQGSDVSDLYRQTEDLMEEDVRLSLAELHDTVNDLTKLHIALERMEVGIHNITSGVNDISHRVRASQVDIANLSTTFSEYAGYSRLNLDSIHQAILELPGRIQAQIAIIPRQSLSVCAMCAKIHQGYLLSVDQGVESNATTLNVATTGSHLSALPRLLRAYHFHAPIWSHFLVLPTTSSHIVEISL
ncbi:hypothetical protein PENSPDRAFT_423494 [Peniophora sp. CONT]|nr:hypothetical protein PENSPDRAFT_423494 [Peniophora sp. CONT]